MSFTDDVRGENRDLREQNLRDENLRDEGLHEGGLGEASRGLQDENLERNRTWDYRETDFGEQDLVGYEVEATDGSLGKIDETSNQAGASHVVVDTGPWIFGTKRLIPAGAISSVDHENQVARVEMTKEQIKSAPEYRTDTWNDEARGLHSEYYDEYATRDHPDHPGPTGLGVMGRPM